ncbi:serine-rich adhesin for platelets-like isoform X2 [Neocloeon triangulifer]|uniref:serine-rich adhesin for platelets-like isoform X2 n=1 Tax=Neocloeon triangulifer TaxID=2078957 RepID=UPI00286F9352|nr:serine-rich adhesin for platelets-like isoform X2 [Neocloeon triangulifer]
MKTLGLTFLCIVAAVLIAPGHFHDANLAPARVRRQASNSTNNSTSTTVSISTVNSTNANLTTLTTNNATATGNNLTASTTPVPAVNATPPAGNVTQPGAINATTLNSGGNSTTTMQSTSTTIAITTTTTTVTTATTKATNSNSTTKVTMTTAKGAAAAYASVPCSNVNPKMLLKKCCHSPIEDFFAEDQKLKCNSYKKQSVMFAVTKEYVLSKYQSKKANGVNFASKAFATNMGKQVCLVECLFRANSLIDSNDNLDTALLETYMAENLDSTWSEVVKTAVTDCAAEVQSVTVDSVSVKYSPKVTKTCKTNALSIAQCILKQIGTKCPASAQDTTTPCKRTRSVLDRCNPFVAVEMATGKQAKVATLTQRSGLLRKRTFIKPANWGPVLTADYKKNK